MPVTVQFVADATPRPVLGSVVRTRGRDDLLVVVAAKAGTFNLAALGGSENRCYRTVPAAHMTLIDPKDVLA